MSDEEHNPENEWIEYEDDEGKTYYYNESTQESSWEVPENAIIVKPPAEDVDVEGGADADVDAATGADDVSMTGEPEEPQEEEGGGGDLGSPVFGNEGGEGDQPMENDDNASAAGDEQEMQGSTTDLPPGWTELMDDNSGVPYYYNEETNVTTWDRPAGTGETKYSEQTASPSGDGPDDFRETGGEGYANSPSLSPRPDQSPPLSPPPSQSPPPDGSDTVEQTDGTQNNDVEQEVIEEKEEEVVVPKKDPKEIQLELATENLAKPDAILEPRAAEHVRTLLREQKKKGSAVAMKSLVSTYGSMTATCGLLTKWVVDLSTNDIDSSKATSSSTSNKRNTSKKRNQAADPIRQLIESVIIKTAKEHYTTEAQENILNLKSASDRNFLQEMMEHPPWRRLLIDLSASHPNSPLLTYCLKEISKRGYHREIAKRIQNQSDYFDVFHGMLVSELCRLGNTSVNGNTFSFDNDLVKDHTKSSEGEEWNIDMEALVEDLKRTCTSTAYTYIYTREMLNELIKRATNKAKTASGPKSLGLARSIKKWSRIAEELEYHMMKSQSSSKSQSFNTLSRKRRMDISLVVNELQQKQRRRTGNNNSTSSSSSASTSLSTRISNQSLDSGIIAIMRRYSMGTGIDEYVLDQLLRTSDDNFEQIGQSLIDHQLAINALMHALYVHSGGKIHSIGIKRKCAKLVAMAVIAAEKKLIDSLNEEDKSEDWFQKKQKQDLKDVDLIADMIVQGSQLCEEAENVVKFVVTDEASETLSSGSVGSKLSLLCMKCAPVSEGFILWAREKCNGNEFAESAAYPTLAPGILSLSRIVAKHHPFSRESVVDLAVLFLRHSSSELSFQKMNAIKEQSLRLLLIVLTQGLGVHIFQTISLKIKKGELDSNLIRYFISSVLDIVCPPVSMSFIHAFSQLLTTKSCIDALKSNFFDGQKKKALTNLISSFKTHVSERRFTGSEKMSNELVSSLHDIYNVTH